MRSLAPLALILLLTACGEGESLLPPDARLPDGGRYRGEVVNGLLEGQGRIDYPNGSWYAGEFKNGLWHGQGNGTPAMATSIAAASSKVCIAVKAA